MSPERIRQLLSQWARRAMVLGYLQHIPAADAVAAGYGPGHLMEFLQNVPLPVNCTLARAGPFGCLESADLAECRNAQRQ